MVWLPRYLPTISIGRASPERSQRRSYYYYLLSTAVLLSILNDYLLSTAAVLLGASTGITLHNYLKQKGLTLEQLMQGDNNLAKVWALFFKWISFWKGHKIGIRRGNSEMQFANLAAFAPLFPCTGRVNYFKSVTHFLAEYERYPQLQEFLQHACSVNITQEGHYLAFDEALEFFGVKFVKQNLKNRIIDENDLKQQIKAVQTRTDLLFSIFNDNHVPTESAHAVNNRSATVERLTQKMLEAFDSQSPEEHSLFRGCTQLTPTGYDKIFESYEDGIDRLQDFYNQEIIHTEKIDDRKSTSFSCDNPL